MMQKKYLFIGAHTDDIELSCGGTIHKMRRQNSIVHCVVMTNCGLPHLITEMNNAMKRLKVNEYQILGYERRKISEQHQEIRDILYRKLNEERYTAVFTHNPLDKHPDHSSVGLFTMSVHQSGGLYTYCSPFNSNVLDENYFIKLDRKDVDMKVKALGCYESQKHRQYMNQEVIKANALVRGLQCDSTFAEAFKVIKHAE